MKQIEYIFKRGECDSSMLHHKILEMEIELLHLKVTNSKTALCSGFGNICEFWSNYNHRDLSLSKTIKTALIVQTTGIFL